jgi:hypothetical protein
MTPVKPSHTPPRQIRIGDEWYDFDAAAKAAGTTRAALINAFIAWYLHEPDADLPTRPDRAAWATPGE